MTYEFLSMMLGVRRPGVTIAAGMLQKAGLSRYARGRMAIVDRPGLETASCECYHTVRHEFARLLGPGPAKPPGWSGFRSTALAKPAPACCSCEHLHPPG